MKPRFRTTLSILSVLILLLPAMPIYAQMDGEYGDAPDNAIAYPSLGVNGQFPTCTTTPSGFVIHGIVNPMFNAYFGPALDFEPDGNAGICPQPPYDQDECFADADAGLIHPPSWTIVGGVEVPCQQAGPDIGIVCTTAQWGPSIDTRVTNNTTLDIFVNVTVDWDQSGTWGGASSCPTAAAPEWILRNFPIPPGFTGPLSALGPPAFLIGPKPGFVWVRFTISEQQILAADWDGKGNFQLGESEDYLLTVAPDEPVDREFGDAPDGAMAYPSLGVAGNFPTCLSTATGVVVHAPDVNVYFGPALDWEPDGNAGICPQPPYDQDECFQDGDAGLIHPPSWTIVGGVEVPCQQAGPDIGPVCTTAQWGPSIDTQVTNNTSLDIFVNVTVDWDQSGTWGGASSCPTAAAPEWILRNFPIPPGFIGPLSALGPPAFLIGPKPGFVWVRFTISEQQILAADWDGQGSFELGESEDYLLTVGLPQPIDLEYGDAPDGATAYPSLGVPGNFPTCLSTATGVVVHQPDPNAFFGPTLDWEPDGNAGICPQPPYDQDECFADGDAGLILPGAWTIVGGVETPCTGQPGPDLGIVCKSATWGGNIDIRVTNNTNLDLFVNVAIDWDRSGTWGRASPCPIGPTPEWILRNFAIPPGFVGPLSALSPPGFLIGPHPDYVWARLTLSEQQILTADWDGQGAFDLGESEDYLFHIAPEEIEGEFGDAPEDALAYPSGVFGFFPTCVNIGPAGFVYHGPLGQSWFGPMADFELDGNAGVCPFPPYDQDECYRDGDAGLIVPEPFTIVGLTFPPCPGFQGTRLGYSCLYSRWGLHLDINLTNISGTVRFVNVLMDWDQNGSWGGSLPCPNSAPQPEHFVQNLPVPPGYSGKLSTLIGPGFFLVPARPGFVWSRFTISDTPVPNNWDGSGIFDDGESEDYMLWVDNQQSGARDGFETVPGLAIEPSRPNPFEARTSIAWVQGSAGPVRVTIHDVAGRLVRTLVDGPEDPGRHERLWDGSDDLGRRMNTGLYIVRVKTDAGVRTQKIVMR